MNGPDRVLESPPPTASASTFLGTFGLVFAAILGLFSFDTFLARIDRNESRAEAARLYDQGLRLLRAGQAPSAIDHLKSAISINRTVPSYQLALSEAELTAGRPAEAEATLNDLLSRDATSGPPNLAMARVLTALGRTADASSYYHRAIYGQWPSDEAQNRVETRLELVDHLVRQHATEALLAELLPLAEEVAGDSAIRKRVAGLFLQANSPGHAVEAYRKILLSNPTDPDAHAGLAEAELAEGNYSAAIRELTIAARLAPSDSTVAGRLTLVTRVLALDPTARRLTVSERYQRSRDLLASVIDDLERCDRIADAMRSQVDSAKAGLRYSIPPSRREAAYQDNLDVAEHLWKIRVDVCGPATGGTGAALAMVLAKVTR